MAILAVARSIVSKDDIAATSNVKSTTLFAPSTYLSNVSNVTKAVSDMENTFSSFKTFSNVSFQELSAVSTFLPKACLAHDSTDEKT